MQNCLEKNHSQAVEIPEKRTHVFFIKRIFTFIRS